MDSGFWLGLLVTSGLLGAAWIYFRSEEKERQSARERARPHIAGREVRDRLREMAEPSLLLLPAIQGAFSKFGGVPKLPEQMAWPTVDGVPRTFIAQLDLSEVRAAEGPDWLPSAGRLFFFHNPVGNGTTDLVSVVRCDDPGQKPCSPPVGLSRMIPELQIGFRRVTSLPNLEWLGLEHYALDDDHPEEWDEIAKLATAPSDDEIQHRIGGFPNEIQDEQMPLSCEALALGLAPPKYQLEATVELQQAASVWRLLVQFDSDPSLGLDWGRGGRLYVFVRKMDAIEGDFSKTVTLRHSY